MNKELAIGLVGLDSSHCVDFTELLNNTGHVFHVPGGRVTAAFKGGSPDMELSSGRIEGFTNRLKEQYAIRLVDDLETLVDQVDAVLITSVDGRAHLDQFAAIAAAGKPVFVDKPLATQSGEAAKLLGLAKRYRVPMMCSSSLRYSEGLIAACAEAKEQSPVFGADCYGPMKLEPQLPGWFWYGVHMVDMLYAVMGTGCEQVTAVKNDDSDLVLGEWKDGRVGVLRGNRMGNNQYGCLLHSPGGSRHVDTGKDKKPYYAIMLERVMDMFRTGVQPIASEEMLEVVRFMEAANESRINGTTVRL